jgi:hypothetical protein
MAKTLRALARTMPIKPLTVSKSMRCLEACHYQGGNLDGTLYSNK